MIGQLQDRLRLKDGFRLLSGFRFDPYKEFPGHMIKAHHMRRFSRPAVSDRPCLQMTGCIHNITDHSAGRRKLTGAAAVEHCISQHISVDEDRVENIVDSVQRVFIIHKERRYHSIAAFLHLFAGG